VEGEDEEAVMTTTTTRRHEDVRSGATSSWWSADARGPRRHQADAAAGFRGRDGRVAVALADGVGDSPAAGRTARIAADHAVRAAVLDGRADLAVLATRDLLASSGRPGDTTLTVALGPDPRQAEPVWTLAWVGDTRALALRPDGVHLLTDDHTVGAEMRGAGIAVAPHLDHVLTTSVRTVRGATEVGLATVGVPATIVLLTDGVHRVLPPARLAGLAAVVGTPALAQALVGTATAAGTHDNATALVVTASGLPVPRPRRG
jgi:PPM family protein phosphatase